ncbi:MBOAT family O-acyltransferase [Deinococcus yavapaiensis]|uniref:Alginate O-acetyltransferase complex protein AlgI n=1 Tax=Deinococcus yavapaiensis KR-236 TaxID=694435 RepID=A0A318S431_9DEIO|nr:MBOAT family protein [Deinococcus yavapaiensis]PYE52820.1 alginate O-acetyltransferase complex protein AlgI [Deinococcus yavapaiensis KR-236]
MVFSSNIFLFVFLPIFLAVYFLLPFRAKSAWILTGSYAFYGWWRFDFLALLFAVTLASYLVALGMVRAPEFRRRAWLSAGIVGNLAVLAYFKYANFGVSSFNTLVSSLGLQPFAWAPVLLPIGLSFFIFHAISYLVDVYRGGAAPTRNFIDFAAFIALFPHLIAGPVLKYNLLAEQFRSRVHSFALFGQGSHRFMIGFAKKVLIADTIAPLVGQAFDLPNPSMADAWLGTVAYTLQLYFDFSGYSDMAIGLALMLGFRFPENFDHPYISRSITEFWRRWHMSLSSWLREYLYISLGGNRRGRARTYVNLWLTMVLGGLWHGANWTFVLWGAWHGSLLAFERWHGEAGKNASARTSKPPVLAMLGTLLLVMLGWVLFRAESVGSAWTVYRGLFGFNGLALSDDLAWQVRGSQVAVMLLALAFVFVSPSWSRWSEALNIKKAGMRFALRSAVAFVVLPLFALSVLKLNAQSYTPFLYFQF